MINQFNNNIKVNKIFHISDIHIRLYNRLDEYKYIFNKLYKYLIQYISSNDYNLIVITGDLFHSKNELSPESIILALSFLKKLTSIFPVILIAGNHDAVLNNKHRIDSISAILSAIKIKNLFYFKHSGVYQIYNILFCVNSILDNFHINYNYIKNSLLYDNINDFIIVGLYHGAVDQVITDVGYRLKGNKLLKDFIGYDYLLLGDIHKYQYVDNNKRFGYASSLICQNFGETESPHGILIWDLKNKNSHYHNIYNPYGYHKFYYDIHMDKIYYDNNKFYYDNNKFTDIIKIILPNFRGNIKIIFNNEINNDIVKLFQSILPYSNISTSIKLLSNKPIEYINNIFKDDNNNLMSLIKKYYNHLNLNYNDYNINIIYDELIKLDNDLSKISDYDKNNFNWKFIYLKFDNLFTYGSHNYINLSNLTHSDSVIMGLFANNSAGKSSLIDIITFMLYGKITRICNLGICKDLININETEGYGEIVFKIGDIFYKIIKKLKKNKNNKIQIYYEKLLSSTSINFDNNFNDLSSIHRLKTDKLITKLIGSYDEFIFTSISLQIKDKSFKDLSQKDRKEFINKILKLDYFKEDTIKIINEKYRDIKQLIDKTNEKLSNINIEIINTDIIYLQKQLDEKYIEKTNISSKLDNLINIIKNNNIGSKDKYLDNKSELQNIDNMIRIYNDKINIISKEIHNINDINLKVLKLEKKCEIYEELFHIYNKKINYFNEKIEITNESLDIYHKKYELMSNIYDDSNIEINNYSNKFDEINNDIINLSNKLNDMNNIKKTYDILNIELIQLKKDYDIYNFLHKFTGRDGISLLILKEWLPIISNKINSIIDPYINKKIYLELINDSIIMNTYLSSNKLLFIYGGMESFILDIAFKIVLSELAILPKSNLLIIDEGISVLDKDHINDISFLFEFLKKYYDNILIISHLHDIKPNIDILLNITSNNKQSRIYYN